MIILQILIIQMIQVDKKWHIQGSKLVFPYLTSTLYIYCILAYAILTAYKTSGDRKQKKSLQLIHYSFL